MFHPTLHCILHSLACARQLLARPWQTLKHMDAVQKRRTLHLQPGKMLLPSLPSKPLPAQIPSGNHKTDICHFDKPEYPS